MRKTYLAISGLLAGLIFLINPGVSAIAEPIQIGTQVAQAGNCFAIGQRVAAEMGGTLAAANAENRGGQTVCRIVVVIPGANGQRPKRTEVVVPAG